MLSQKALEHKKKWPIHWPDVLEILRNKLTKAAYDQHIKPLEIIKIENETILLSCTSNSAEWLENRLKSQILGVLREINNDIKDVCFEPVAYAPIANLDISQPLEEDDTQAEAAFVGAYHDQRNAIIQPDKLEIHTQYFRRRWRPLLGPTLSELIRELRQRCHYRSRRNVFKTTYKNLAQSLGVSEKTIKRALQRDEQGQFKNVHLNKLMNLGNKDITFTLKLLANDHRDQ